MSYTAADGKRFASSIAGRRYDESNGVLVRKSLADIEDAPGGASHQDSMAHHGLARKVVIEREGNGRTRIEWEHADGTKGQMVHPETFRAHEMGRELLGIEAPPAVQTHGRSRSQPQGPKENERIKKEDGRVDEEEDSRG